jgi:hypothetical protein
MAGLRERVEAVPTKRSKALLFDLILQELDEEDSSWLELQLRDLTVTPGTLSRKLTAAGISCRSENVTRWRERNVAG